MFIELQVYEWSRIVDLLRGAIITKNKHTLLFPQSIDEVRGVYRKIAENLEQNYVVGMDWSQRVQLNLNKEEAETIVYTICAAQEKLDLDTLPSITPDISKLATSVSDQANLAI